MVALLLLFLTSCFWIEKRPPPTMDDFLGTFYINYLETFFINDEGDLEYRESGIGSVEFPGTLEVYIQDDTTFIEIDLDTAATYSFWIDDVTFLRSGVAFNIPAQIQYLSSLETTLDIEGALNQKIRGTTYYAGYADVAERESSYMEFVFSMQLTSPDTSYFYVLDFFAVRQDYRIQ